MLLACNITMNAVWLMGTYGDWLFLVAIIIQAAWLGAVATRIADHVRSRRELRVMAPATRGHATPTSYQ